MDAEELLELFGIELMEDKTVYDPVIDRSFRSVVMWKEYIDTHDDDGNYGGFDKGTGGGWYDDEY